MKKITILSFFALFVSSALGYNTNQAQFGSTYSSDVNFEDLQFSETDNSSNIINASDLLKLEASFNINNASSAGAVVTLDNGKENTVSYIVLGNYSHLNISGENTVLNVTQKGNSMGICAWENSMVTVENGGVLNMNGTGIAGKQNHVEDTAFLVVNKGGVVNLGSNTKYENAGAKSFANINGGKITSQGTLHLDTNISFKFQNSANVEFETLKMAWSSALEIIGSGNSIKISGNFETHNWSYDRYVSESWTTLMPGITFVADADGFSTIDIFGKLSAFNGFLTLDFSNLEKNGEWILISSSQYDNSIDDLLLEGRYSITGIEESMVELLYDEGKLSVSVSGIPEPSTYAAIFGVSALLFVAYRRRK